MWIVSQQKKNRSSVSSAVKNKTKRKTWQRWRIVARADLGVGGQRRLGEQNRPVDWLDGMTQRRDLRLPYAIPVPV